VSPANYPEAFAVGAIDNTDQIYAASSRGPSACGEAQTIYPELSAPGVNVNTTDRLGFYTQQTGTSLSAPQAAGVLALLLNAYPNLTAYQQHIALASGAVDLGTPGADNTFGYGRLNALASYQWLQAGGSTVTPPPPPSPTPTPAPTATPTPTPTPVPASTLHVGDLDRSATLSGSKWNAIVTVYVHDNNEKPVANATVSGGWTNGATGTVSCTTNSSGTCQVSKTGLNTKTTSSVTFTATGVTHATLTYKSSANHDPDGDSNGTSIVISKP
jgi:subtilisin family serine protease